MNVFADERRLYKAAQLSYDKHITDPSSTDECLYCLTEPQTRALIAVIEFYRYATRWYTTDVLETAKIEQFVNDIQRRLMMSCCNDGVDEQLQALRGMQAFEFFKLDDGTPQSYAPDTRDYFNRDSAAAGEDIQRANQLCIAVRSWCYAYAREYIKYLSAIGAIGGAGAGIAFYTGNPVLGFIFAISTAIIESLGATAITDGNAMNRVICCMIDGLMEQTISQANFRAALDNCDFAFGTHSAQIAGALASFNQTDENYRAFLVLLGQSKASASAVDDNCPECENCYEWDFAASDGDWVTQPTWPGGGSAGAIYSGGAWRQNTPGGSATTNATLYIHYDFVTPVTVKDIEITFVDGGMQYAAAEATGIIGQPSPYTLVINASKSQLLLFVYDSPGTATFEISKVRITSESTLPTDITGGSYDC